jgi:hypothetical protein
MFPDNARSSFWLSQFGDKKERSDLLTKLLDTQSRHNAKILCARKYVEGSIRGLDVEPSTFFDCLQRLSKILVAKNYGLDVGTLVIFWLITWNSNKKE